MKWTREKLVARWNEIGQEMRHVDMETADGNATAKTLIEEMNELVGIADTLADAENAAMTLEDELAAEFENHGPTQGGTWDRCLCGWRGLSFSGHLAKVATRITNARVEGLIREAAEAGFKIRKPYGEPEYGVIYPAIKGEEPKRILGLPDKHEADSFLKLWLDQGEKALMLTRQWRAM